MHICDTFLTFNRRNDDYFDFDSFRNMKSDDYMYGMLAKIQQNSYHFIMALLSNTIGQYKTTKSRKSIGNTILL